MAIADAKKVDYLWKKIGYGATKTDTNANKAAPNEAIASPLLLTISFKAIKIYKEGYLFYVCILGIVLSAILTFFTLFFAFKTFKTLIDALFSE